MNGILDDEGVGVLTQLLQRGAIGGLDGGELAGVPLLQKRLGIVLRDEEQPLRPKLELPAEVVNAADGLYHVLNLAAGQIPVALFVQANGPRRWGMFIRSMPIISSHFCG